MNRARVTIALLVALFMASCASRDRSKPPAPTGVEERERDQLRSDSVAISSDEAAEESAKAETPKAVPVAALVEGNNQFALDLLKHVDSGSVAYSPFAVSMGGLVLESAADTETRDQLRTALRLRIDEGIVAEKVRVLRDHVGSRSKHGFDPGVVHHLWLSSEIAPDRRWLQQVSPDFDAVVELADMSDVAASRVRVDETMSTATVSAVDGVTGAHDMGKARFVLAAAAAPRGAWEVPFERGLTREAIFTNADGTKGNRPVMRGSGRFRYYEDGSAQVVALPYDDGATAIIVLPRDGTFTSVESSISYPKLKHYIASLRSKQVDVTLPKVEIDSALDLVPILKSMGVTAAFAPDADFSVGLGPDSTPVDMFVHKAVFSFDEDGTRAQARSVQARRQNGGVQFEATRPFLVFVRDDDTGQILLVARVT